MSEWVSECVCVCEQAKERMSIPRIRIMWKKTPYGGWILFKLQKSKWQTELHEVKSTVGELTFGAEALVNIFNIFLGNTGRLHYDD
jgi:hypothetical protein